MYYVLDSVTRVLEQPAGDVADTLRLQVTHSRRHYRPQVSQEIPQIICFFQIFILTSVVDPDPVRYGTW
jgi:hypothetical protein